MLGANLFFKKPQMVTGDYQMRKRPVATNFGDAYNRDRYGVGLPRIDTSLIRGGQMFTEHNNQGAREIVGHRRFGFQTMLNEKSFGQLPTAPAVVGGNVDWTKSKVTPLTQSLHSKLSEVRPMNMLPTIGSGLKLLEPSINSIHKQY